MTEWLFLNLDTILVYDWEGLWENEVSVLNLLFMILPLQKVLKKRRKKSTSILYLCLISVILFLDNGDVKMIHI